MQLAAAQIATIPGDLNANRDRHLQFISTAAQHKADLILFPELSMTGYEPALARELAITPDDTRLAEFQTASDSSKMVIALGAPLKTAGKPLIGMIVFQPHQRPLTYAKTILHADELPYFTAGTGSLVLSLHGHRLALAICYESLQESHARNVTSEGADWYLASVAKSAGGIAKANAHYPTIAKAYGLSVLMANNVGPCDNFVGAGGSAVWGKDGERRSQLDETEESILLFDTVNQVANRIIA